MRFLFWEFRRKKQQEGWLDRMELIVEEVGQALLVLISGLLVNLLFFGVLEQITSF